MKLMKKYILAFLLVVLFLSSRLYVLFNPPYADSTPTRPGHGYSDVKHDSERYANMWYYGLTPYRKHLYEYPPIAIPFVYTPLLVDQAGVGHYYQNYRTGIFLFELILFVFLMKAVSIIWRKQRHRGWIALLFYCAIGAIGKDFWYDGLDLVFIGFYAMALIVRYLTGTKKLWQKIVFWALFSASFGVKYMTLPLALPLFWMNRKTWKKEVIGGLLGFLLVWGVPLALYRSSLSVMVFYHTSRPFNYGSLGKWVVSAVNDFTHTETQTTILPHLPIVGPVATVTEKIFGILFLVALPAVIFWATWLIHKQKRAMSRDKELRFTVVMTLLFFMAIFLTNKVFSNPFHIWYVPLIVLLPLGTLTEQLWLMAGAGWMTMLDTTPWIRVSSTKFVGPVPYARIRDFTRFIPMSLFARFSIRSLLSGSVDRAKTIIK